MRTCRTLDPWQVMRLRRTGRRGGESFLDVCQRIGPAVREMAAAGDVTVVAHAGTVRAALALAVGPTAALAFEVAPLSVTRLRALPGGGWAIAEVNWTAP